MMNYPVLFYLLLALTAYCVQAIEFSLMVDADSPTVNGVTSRGAVKCVAEINPNEPGSIKRLSIYRNKEDGVLLVELSALQESINRTTNDITVNGTLTPHKAEATLYLMTTHDCHDAEYSCEVIHVGNDSVERSNYSARRFHGKSRSSENPGNSIKQGLTSNNRASDNTALSAALQLSAIIQQTQAYLAGRIERVQYMLHDKLFEIDSTLSLLEKKHRSIDDNDLICKSFNISKNIEEDYYNKVHKRLASLEMAINKTASDRLSDGTELYSLLSQLENKTDSILVQSNATIVKYKDAANECIKEKNNPTICPREPSLLSKTKYQVVIPDDGSSPYLCDTDGGWTVIQRRVNGYTDFYRNWESYQKGFGSFDNDFWLGLDQIHNITSKFRHELMITMMFNGKLAHAHYSNFYIGREFEGYRLSVDGYTGTAGDSLSFHDNLKFSTHDRDNDKSSSEHCAQVHAGAWWFNNCDKSNLNGKWGETSEQGPEWETFSGTKPLTMTEMKIRIKL